MRYEARITAYDMLDHVCTAMVLWQSDGDPLSQPEVVLRTSVSQPGEGESDPRRWARDALVNLLETL